jgi:sec-independent protein translocase protein TatB
MFNIGFTELIILGVIALLVIGPEQLPDMARRLAKLLNELKRAKEEIMSPVDEMTAEAKGALERMRREADNQIHSQVSQIMNNIKPTDDNDGHEQHIITKNDEGKKNE